MEKNPVDRAKSIIDAKAKERKHKEELKKQEEDNRLKSLSSRVLEMYESFKKAESELSGLEEGLTDTERGVNLLRMRERDAVNLLKSDIDTKELFEEKKDSEDPEATETHHIQRKEMFDQVFGEAQDQKRSLKRDKREIKKDISVAKNEKTSILKQLEELRSSKDWEQLIKMKQDEILALSQDYKSFFYQNSKEKDQARIYEAFTNLEKFETQSKEKISTLKQAIQTELATLLEEEKNMFDSAKKSPEYQPGLFGDVDFEKYKNLLPKNVEDIVFKAYSYDSDRLSFPQFEQGSLLKTELMNDINLISDEIEKIRQAIITKSSRMLFSGTKNLEQKREVLQKKKDFIIKISNSIDEYIRSFNNKKYEGQLSFNEHRRDTEMTYSKLVVQYINQIRQQNSYSYISDTYKNFPEFKRDLRFNDLFDLVSNKGEMTAQYKESYDKAESLKNAKSTKLEEYDFLMGQRGSGDRLFG